MRFLLPTLLLLSTPSLVYAAQQPAPPHAFGWARLYLVPGMTHCGGGPALDDFDALAALESWVESGEAPDVIPAHGKAFPNRNRNLCTYPGFAQYKGSGSPDEAANFSCKLPMQLVW